MTRTTGQVAIEAEMARQMADARATFVSAGRPAEAVAESLRSTRRLVLLGMGASHAANRAAEPLYRAVGIEAVALPVSEQLGAGLPLADKTVILVSQSGESAEVLRWLETDRAGQVFGMSMNADATLSRAVLTLVASGGPEHAFAATRSLTLTMVLHLAVLSRLGHDPTAALALLDAVTPDVGPAITAMARTRCIVTSGRRLQGLAEAAALGLCELSRKPAFALEGGQLRHGPMEIMGPEVGVVLFASDEVDATLVHGMARSANETGSPVVLFDSSGAAPFAGVTTVTLPKCGDMAAILAILPAMQRFMVGFAATRVDDLGTPRRSSKVTRTE